MNVIPVPNNIIKTKNFYILSRDVKSYCSADNIGFADHIFFLLRKIFTSFSGRIITVTDNQFVDNGINFITDCNLTEEEYNITLDINGITVSAATYQGFLYATITLSDILTLPPTKDNEIYIDCFAINDKPKYSWRSFTLDDARHFTGVENVKKILDVMAYNKMNKFIWHLSDDQGYRLQSKVYPKLNTISSIRHDTQIYGVGSKIYKGMEYNAIYTQDEIREIVAYAKVRNIDVIPELSLPNHITAILAAYPELSCTESNMPVSTSFIDSKNLLCISNDKTYDFIEDIIKEWSELFPSKYFHIGGSAVDIAQWENCSKCTEYMQLIGYTNAKDFLIYFYNIVSNILTKYDKTAILKSNQYSVILDPKIIIQITKDDDIIRIIESMDYNRLTIMSDTHFTNCDLPYAITPLRSTYNYRLCNSYVSNQIEYSPENILGGNLSLWTEWVYDAEKIDYCILPRIPAFAECLWSYVNDYENFTDRFYNNTKIYDASRYYYAKKTVSEPNRFYRLIDSFRWLSSDQYSELRRNRKAK